MAELTAREELVILIAQHQQEFPTLRFGQAAFTVCHELFPEETERLRGTLVDPFYQDEKVPEFLDRLGI